MSPYESPYEQLRETKPPMNELIPKEIIELAIDSGYDAPVLKMRLEEHKNKGEELEILRLTTYAANVLVLDPLFWQAIGKGLGWKDYLTVCPCCEYEVPSVEITYEEKHSECGSLLHYPAPYRWHAHRLYDLILTSADTKTFWSDLLANKKIK